MSFADGISLSRLFSTPFICWFIWHQHTMLALWTFIGAGVTDLLDGLFARVFKAQSDFGKYLDPLADKVLLDGTFLTLWAMGYAPWWLTILVIARDIALVVMAILAYRRDPSIPLSPNMTGKVSTAMQMLFVVLILVAHAYGVQTHLRFATDMVSLTTALLAVISILLYIRRGRLYVAGQSAFKK
ncbi:MAG: CDP-alcohol phosphatidyltransferase family protein [Holosporales bacterium]